MDNSNSGKLIHKRGKITDNKKVELSAIYWFAVVKKQEKRYHCQFRTRKF
jgi:hypothetical protein